MNELLWLVYASDIARNVVFLLMFVLIISVAVFCLIWMVSSDDGPRGYHSDEENKKRRDAQAICYGRMKKLGLCACVTAVLLAFMPSPRTLNAVIAARAGQLMLQTNLGQKSVQAIEAVLDKVIAGAKKADE